jgi:DNA helicase-2/ATP-dependent DNA helicase PcrA
MNTLTLAVAGGRKTQGVVDACLQAQAGHRALVLTYTTANQESVMARLAPWQPSATSIAVSGWFSFLLSHWIRPYLPRLFPGRTLRGMQFEGDGGRYATGDKRHLTEEGLAYRWHLASLAVKVDEASGGAVLDRLGRIYDRIWIDEIQDLNGYDLVVLERLMDAGIEVKMVGDVRQAILQTNIRDPKYKQYKGVAIKDWFDLQVKARRLKIVQRTTTWRCNQAIATLADSIFGPDWGFEPTISANEVASGHDGLFAVTPDHAAAYVEAYGPLCLRRNASSARTLALPFVNIGMAKGLEREHVLIAPTAAMREFFQHGTPLEPAAACSLYVAVTRARSSVAVLAEDPDQLALTVWKP